MLLTKLDKNSIQPFMRIGQLEFHTVGHYELLIVRAEPTEHTQD